MTVFKIAEVYELSTRNIIVLSGNILSGAIYLGISLLNKRGEEIAYVLSVEAINSSPADGLIGLLIKDAPIEAVSFIDQLKKMML